MTDPRIDLQGLRPGAAVDGQGIVLNSGIWVPGDVVRSVTSAVASVVIDNSDPLHPDLSVAGGGGGGGSSFSYVLDPTSSLHATYGDHFTAASLAAKWSRQGYTSTGENFAVGPLRAWPGGATTFFRQDSSATSNKYYWQAAPAGDFTALMRCSIVATGGAPMFGLMITDSSGNGVCGGIYSGTDGYYTFGCTAGAYNSTATSIASPVSAYAWAGGEVWYKVNKTGTAYKTSISTNGQEWRPYTPTLTFATTPTRIGFGNVFGTVLGFSIDWFDVQ